MTVVAPPPVRPPAPDDLEALIEEARRRARRRRFAYAAAVLVLGAAAGLIAAFGGGGGRHSAVEQRGHTPGQPSSRARERRLIERAAAKATIVESGLVAPRLGWAMNGLGLWLTTDGGRHWRTVTPPNVSAAGDAVARIEQIAFVDAKHGWVGASDLPSNAPLFRHMAIDRTTDGGKTWRSAIPPGCGATCGGAELSFLDARQGFALVGPHPQPRLYETLDGGARWRLIGHPPATGTLVFLSSRRAFIVSDGGALYGTTDGGLRWQRLVLPRPPVYHGWAEAAAVPQTFGKETVVVPVRFRDPKTRAQRLVVYVSDDAGATWSAAPAPASADLGAYFWGSRGVPFSAATARDWIVMLGPKLLVTRDAGRSWSVVHASYAPKASRIWDLNFASPTTGWAIFVTRTGDALVRTTDGGRDWSPLTPPVPRYAASKP